jgi:hypothetical protein
VEDLTDGTISTATSPLSCRAGKSRLKLASMHIPAGAARYNYWGKAVPAG